MKSTYLSRWCIVWLAGVATFTATAFFVRSVIAVLRRHASTNLPSSVEGVERIVSQPTLVILAGVMLLTVLCVACTRRSGIRDEPALVLTLLIVAHWIAVCMIGFALMSAYLPLASVKGSL